MRREYNTPTEAVAATTPPATTTLEALLEEPLPTKRPTHRRKGETNYDRVMRVVGLLLAVGLITVLGY